MATVTRTRRPLTTRLLAIVACMLAIVAVTQIAARLQTPATRPPAQVDPLQPTIGDLDGGLIGGIDGGAGAFGRSSATGGSSDGGSAEARSAELDRLRANVAFWSARVARQRDDFISSNRWGIAEIELARATGDLDAYVRAEAAFDTTLARDPTNAAALGYKGAVLVSLHRFVDARALAQQVLSKRPTDPVALATLGDASLELGDLTAARDAYQKADVINHSSATLVRLAHLAFIEGDTASARTLAEAAVKAGDGEDVQGERAAFLRYQLADVLVSTSDLDGAGREYAAALRVDPGSFLALSGLARVAAAKGDLDDAIDRLSAAISIVPQPEFLARRGDLYTLRAKAGDADRARADYQTVEAIARLAAQSASVYDRTLVYYLANHGLDPDRAVRLAADELAVRKDVYGYDAYAWALYAAGRLDEAEAAMSQASSFGTRDAKLMYHAGMIAAALGKSEDARADLDGALRLDPSFDPLQVRRARQTLAGL